MPIYEYRCIACGHQVEVIQKVGAPPLRRCSRCQGKMEKLVSRAAFLLKGGGWYAEGYAKAGGSKGGDSKSESKSDSKPESKSETKSDAKPDRKAAGA